MTREQGNEEKRKVIELIKSGNFEYSTVELLSKYTHRNSHVRKLRNLDSSIAAYRTKEAVEERDKVRAYITLRFSKNRRV
jgi:hypothetical protein